MTLRGLVVTLLELVLLVFAFGTEMHEFLIVALCLGVLEIYSFVSILLASITLSVRSKTDKSTAVRKEGAKYTLTLRGIALLPVAGYLSIKNADYEDKKLKRKKHSFLMLPSFVIEHKFKFNIPCEHIGTWETGIKKLRFEDVFGLFSFPLLRSKKAQFFSKLSVVPKIHNLENESETLSVGDYGLSSTLDSEQGELLGDSRLYREGDTLKRINWKLSARTKTLYARQYEMLQNPKIVIAVDMGVKDFHKGDIIDISCESVISLAEYFVKNSHTVDIVFLRDVDNLQNQIFTLSAENDILNMQYNLANVKFRTVEQSLSLTQQDNINIMNANRIFLISSNPSDVLLSDFYDLCQSGKLARCIIPYFVQEENQQNIAQLHDEIVVRITEADQIEQKIGGAL